MGAKINMENRQDDLERRMKLVEDALEEMVQTRVHHVDLVDDISLHGTEVEPDKVTKKTAKKEKVKVVESML